MYGKRKKGFTLIELIIVLTISSIVVAGISTKILVSQKKAAKESINSDKSVIKAKSESFVNRVGDYPVLADSITEYRDEYVYEFVDNVRTALTTIKNVQYTDEGDDYLNQRFKVIDKKRLRQNGYIGDLSNNDTAFVYDLSSGVVFYAQDDVDTIIKGLEEAISLKDLRKTKVEYTLGSKKLTKAYAALAVGNMTYIGGEGTMTLIKVVESGGKVQIEDLSDQLPTGVTRVNSISKGEGNELVVGFLVSNTLQFKVLTI